MKTLNKFRDSEVEIVLTVSTKSFIVFIYSVKDKIQTLEKTILFTFQEYESALNYYYRLTKIYRTINEKKYFFSLVEKLESRSEEEIEILTTNFYIEASKQSDEKFVLSIMNSLLEE